MYVWGCIWESRVYSPVWFIVLFEAFEICAAVVHSLDDMQNGNAGSGSEL